MPSPSSALVCLISFCLTVFAVPFAQKARKTKRIFPAMRTTHSPANVIYLFTWDQNLGGLKGFHCTETMWKYLINGLTNEKERDGTLSFFLKMQLAFTESFLKGPLCFLPIHHLDFVISDAVGNFKEVCYCGTNSIKPFRQ